MASIERRSGDHGVKYPRPQRPPAQPADSNAFDASHHGQYVRSSWIRPDLEGDACML